HRHRGPAASADQDLVGAGNPRGGEQPDLDRRDVARRRNLEPCGDEPTPRSGRHGRLYLLSARRPVETQLKPARYLGRQTGGEDQTYSETKAEGGMVGFHRQISVLRSRQSTDCNAFLLRGGGPL